MFIPPEQNRQAQAGPDGHPMSGEHIASSIAAEHGTSGYGEGIPKPRKLINDFARMAPPTLIEKPTMTRGRIFGTKCLNMLRKSTAPIVSTAYTHMFSLSHLNLSCCYVRLLPGFRIPEGYGWYKLNQAANAHHPGFPWQDQLSILISTVDFSL